MSTGRTETRRRRRGTVRVAATALVVTVATAAGAWQVTPARSTTVQPPPGPAPQGMVWVPGGTRVLGDDHGRPDERPSYTAHVNGFWMDRTPVTVAQFATFVKQTGYRTTADRFGSGEVMQFGTGHWSLVPGADWRHPFGPQADAARADHPVTQVSWDDAHTFCAAEGRRLPTEAEWEYSARYGLPQGDQYAFGKTLVEQGHYRANVWTGHFPVLNTDADGYPTTSPVGAFGHTQLGLTDMAGNVWEWMGNWYRPYSERNASFQPTAKAQKALRGGSFLCDAKVCHGYRVAARAHATPDSSLMQVGFRCAADAHAPQRQVFAPLPQRPPQLVAGNHHD